MEPDYMSPCIPLDVCTLILSYLPVKWLLRCRSVSKEWKLVIDNPDFASLHMSNYSNNFQDSHLIVLEDSPSDTEVSREHRAHLFSRSTVAKCYKKTSEFNFLVPHLFKDIWRLDEYSIIAGAVDGMLLVQTKRSVGEMILGDVVLWNPSIRKSINVQLPPQDLSGQMVVNVRLGLAVIRQPIVDLCLGFDTSTNDYKVVNIVHREQSITLEIFSLKFRSWRKGRSIAVGGGIRHLIEKQSDKLSFQGSVHWVGTDFYEDGGFDKAFISLNLMTETLSYTQLPDASLHNVDIPIVVAGSSLGLLIVKKDVSDIWVLERNGHWSKRFTVEIATSDLNKNVFNPRLYLNKDGVLIWQSDIFDSTTPRGVIKLDTHICSFDINNGEKGVISKCQTWPWYIGAYVESLVLLT